MTIAELERSIDSKKRRIKEEDQRRATFDYILADLIGRSVARVYNSSNEMPAISAVYPTLFDGAEEQERIVEKQDTLSAARFRQFAESFNKRHKEVARVE